MSECTQVSVDLTEDEDSCEEISSGAGSGFQFVDCSSNNLLSPGISPIKKQTANVNTPPPLTPIRKFVSLQQCDKPTIRLKPLPKITRKPETVVHSSPISSQKVNLLKVDGERSLTKHSSSHQQIKPVVNQVAASQGTPRNNENKFEIICIDSDGESPSVDTGNRVKPMPSVAPASRPPGKMLVIKKNNKFYEIIIPHNVIPDINQSTGPVLINIPEVGPLVITSDHKGTNPLQMQNTRLNLNLDAIRQVPNQSSMATKEVVVPPVQDEPVEDQPTPENREKREQLYNTKFCWRYMKGRKRDLDGFTYYDRFGFNKSEAKRAVRCARNLEAIVAKKHEDLVKLMSKYQRFKSKNAVEVKIVKISDIVGKKRGRKRKKKPATNSSSSEDPLQINESKVLPSNDEYKEYDSDLLLTKKVVFLNGKKKEVDNKYKNPIPGTSQRKGRLRKEPFLREMNLVRAQEETSGHESFSPHENFIPKPCFVQMTRDEQVEEAYYNYCEDMGLKHKRKHKSNINKHTENIVDTIETEDSSDDQGPFTTKDVNCTKLSTKIFYQNIVKIFSMRVIDTEERFRKEMSQLKPLLLVNEQNLTTLNYSSEFSKNNIIYVVKKKFFPKNILRYEGFISGVELGYIKLVDSDLFCKYIMDPVAFLLPKTNTCSGEHNYCFVKKK